MLYGGDARRARGFGGPSRLDRRSTGRRRPRTARANCRSTRLVGAAGRWHAPRPLTLEFYDAALVTNYRGMRSIVSADLRQDDFVELFVERRVHQQVHR